MAIIAVLAGLLLGPVAKVMRNARAMQWGEVAGTQMHGVITAMRKFLGNRTDYPTVTLPDLEALTLFNQAQLSFLHDRRVAFYPFSPSDPGDKVVLAVQIESGFLTSAAAWTATKEQVTKPLP